jgi:dephospho-CoA kinase
MSPARTFRVGLTGGIASGKSTVAALFGALGVPIIDADVVAREVVASGSPTLARIIERFGPELLQADGSLDRRGLRQLIFADPRARADLEALTHPPIWEMIEQHARALAGLYQMLVVPLLIEKQRRDRVDRLLVVDCPESLQIARLQVRDGITRETALAMMGAQATRRDRLAAADDVIVNDSDLQVLRLQVEPLHLRYRECAAQART